MAGDCCHHEHKPRKPFHHLFAGFLGFIIVEITAQTKDRPPPPPDNLSLTVISKDCCHHEHKRRKLFILLFAGLLGFIILVLLVVLLVRFILCPTYPHFVLEDATIYDFNISSAGCLVTSTFQVTLSSLNPNDRIGVYYDRVKVYASYRGQQITLQTVLPPTYQWHKNITVWYPCVYGISVPISPAYCDALTQDQSAGTVLISIKVNGRIRWKVGSFITGKYHLNANCQVYINLGRQNNGVIPVGSTIKYHLMQSCHVDV